MLVAILENLLPANFYNPTLTGLRVDGKVLEELIQERLPRLGNHFRECNVDTTSFCTGWFMRLYVDVFPLKTTLRLWDLMFSEGSKILFRAALSFLKLHEKELLRIKHMGEILHYLNKAPQQQFNYTQLVKTGWGFYSLKRKTIDDLRNKWLRVVNQEIKDMEDRRARMREQRQKQIEREEQLEKQIMEKQEEMAAETTGGEKTTVEEEEQQQEQQKEQLESTQDEAGKEEKESEGEREEEVETNEQQQEQEQVQLSRDEEVKEKDSQLLVEQTIQTTETTTTEESTETNNNNTETVDVEATNC